jgi:hypothetical protein
MAQRDDDFNPMDSSDDRPRRREDAAPPKKKGGAAPILLLIGGILLLGCCGVCGYGGYWFYTKMNDFKDSIEGLLAKLSSSDFAGAYNMMSDRFKSEVTLEQFTDAMKKAKLDKHTGITGKPGQTQNGQSAVITMSLGLPEGKSTTISLTIASESPSNPLKFVLDDLTGPDIKYDKTKPKDDKPKDDKPKDEKTDPEDK